MQALRRANHHQPPLPANPGQKAKELMKFNANNWTKIVVLGVAVLLTSAAFAGNKGSLIIRERVDVAGQQLAPGEYQVRWNGSGSDVQVSFMQGKKEVIKTAAKIVPLYRKYAALLVAATIALLVGVPLMLFYAGILAPETTTALASNEIIGKAYQLADSSEVVMNKNSVVTYSSKYGKRERRVNLKGEAFFAVKHLADKPFLVEANGTLIEDIGTAFNVKAYDSTNTVEVYVESGLVRFYSSNANGITLIAGQTGVYNKLTNTFTIKGDADKNVIAYKTKQLVFLDTPLEIAIKELCLVYDTEIIVANPLLNQCKITVSFNNENIDSILEIIAETLGLTVEKTSTGYRLNGEGCSH